MPCSHERKGSLGKVPLFHEVSEPHGLYAGHAEVASQGVGVQLSQQDSVHLILLELLVEAGQVELGQQLLDVCDCHGVQRFRVRWRSDSLP